MITNSTMTTESHQIIVYKSRWEQETDRILWENPELVLYFIIGMVTIVVGATVCQKFYWRIRRFFHKNNR